MKKIYSKIEEGKLLHIINRLDEINGRTEMVPEDNFIQCATLKMEKGKTFPPHKHITKERTYPAQIAQESWVVPG
jgi:anti-sigma factor ChrR (cupin superfamily)